MKQLFSIICLAYLVVIACQKEPSLPVLKPINEAVIQGIDSIYFIGGRDTISIYPEITFTQDSLLQNPDRYQYEWVYLTQPPVSDPWSDYKTISTEKALIDFVIYQELYTSTGPLDFTFRVTDTYTDTYTEFPFRVILGNAYYEGWMLLTEEDGNARVDMLSYKPTTGTFSHLQDVIQFRSPGIHKPIFIDEVFGTENELRLGGIVVGSNQEIMAFDPEDFWQLFTFHPELADIPMADISSMVYQSSYLNQILYVNGMVYNCDERDGFYNNFIAINNVRTDLGGASFHAAPFVAFNYLSATSESILFNEDTDDFMWFNGTAYYSEPLVEANQFDHERPWELVFLDYTQHMGGVYFGILRDLKNGDLYWIRFTSNEMLGFNKVAEGSVLYQAERFALHPYNGNLYITVGKVLYEYTTTGEHQLRKFQDDITLLQYERFPLLADFSNGTTGNRDRYQGYAEKLIVATHKDADPNNSGKLILYDTENNRAFQQFAGFPKIIDVAYKER